ncbi:MAG: HPr kinase/phosphorylase [Pelotomaculum sp. PtaU1.Bin035]|nr:MAG: HPr kinase/phosphorylase [Pelotomaculum sp. PtaU1.Bin035]
MEDNLTFRLFNIGGVLINVSANNQDALVSFGKWLKPFIVETGGSISKKQSGINVNIYNLEDNEEPPINIPGRENCFYSGYEADYYWLNECLLVDYGDIGRLIVDRGQGHLTGYINFARFLKKPWSFQDVFGQLFGLLREKGIYLYHAGAVSINGCGLLLAGRSGSGKSTLSLRLLDKGFNFIADDRCFLREKGGDIEIIGFLEPVRMYPYNIARIDTQVHLNEACGQNQGSGDEKVSFDVDNYYPDAVKKSSMLKAIVFPVWEPAGKSRLEPLAPGAALKELLPLTMECFYRDTARRQFDFNCDLANKLQSVNLYLGHDVEHWHDLLAGFLSG